MRTRKWSILLGLALFVVPALAWGAAPSEFEDLKQKGWLLAFLGVFATGFLTSLTPCVYPMITITVGIFGAKEATTKARAFGLASMYVLGMVAMFSSLGVVFALTGRATGSGFLLAEPAVVIPIVLLYAVMAASMFGAFELNLPPSLQAKLAGVGGKGVLGAFLMGLVGGLTAAPCTGPMLFGVLAYIAATGDALLGASLMTTFALGMGVLFLVIATFSMRLPKSGAWMEIVKAVGGIALVTVGVWFLRPIVPALEHVEAMVAGIAIGAAGLVGIAAYVKLIRRPWAKLLKGFAIAATTAGAILTMNAVLKPEREVVWRTDRELALADARSAGKPTLIDFSATWCAPCKLYETNVFADPKVHAELAGRFVSVKYDVTKQNAADRKAMTDWSAGLPTVILLDSAGKEAVRFQKEIPTAEAFLAAMRGVR